MKKVKSIGLVGRAKNELARKTAQHAVKLLERHKIKVWVAKELKLRHKNVCSIEEMHVDLILAFGGDGTLLHTFRELGKKQIPVMGVNCGELGFLMDLSYESFDKKLPLILSGKFLIEKRTRLQGTSQKKTLPLALNEFVISPSKSAVIMRYGLKINNDFLWKDASDGLIVSTPTGSTAYSLSAGGPVVSQNSRVFLVLPINSMENAKSLIVTDDSKIEVSGINSAVPCEVIVDGQERFRIENELIVKKAKFPALLARFKVASSFGLSKKPSSKKSFNSKKELNDLPPSAKFVFRVLEIEKSLTQKEIVNITQLPARTVRRALNSLLKKQLVIKRPFLADPRQDLYLVRD